MNIKLSIVIVNYNVKYFIEQALYAVQKAILQVDGAVEVFVVDNNSYDDSVALIKEKFAWVKLIENKENTGFAKANNQALRIAEGEYMLLLNPDTVLKEDTLIKTLNFMDAIPKAGGLGVKMIDGAGNFLPESKRGLPTPYVAFCKIAGLSRLFPKSKKFNQYHLGYLNKNEVHEIDVLSGAFMLMRKKVLDKIGYLDERFFMYGEDVDLSYRIQLAGFKNYYFPNTTIIHYKGESTKKGSLNYVKMFYQSMSLFAEKHFSNGMATIYHTVIQVAIAARALLSIFSGLFKQLWQPFLDAIVIFAGLFLIKNYWENFVKQGIEYPEHLLLINLPLYICVWLISIFLSGGYDKPFQIKKLIQGVLIGTLLNAAVYGFLPEQLRFSRAIILLGAVTAMFSTSLWRYILHQLQPKQFSFFINRYKRIAIAGCDSEVQRVQQLLKEANIEYKFVGSISPKKAATEKQSNNIGHINQIEAIIKNHALSEVIFCNKDVSSNTIINIMTSLPEQMSYRIVQPESNSIVGSQSKNMAGDLYAIDISLNIALPAQKRNKRVLDLMVCAVAASLLPILIFLIKNPMQFIKNWWRVFLGNCSWVGYAFTNVEQHTKLPAIKAGIISPATQLAQKNNKINYHRINYLYAKEYSPVVDLRLIQQGWRKFGELRN